MTDIKYPKGYKRDGETQIAVRFKNGVFADIVKRAKRERRTFNDMVVFLVQCGALCLDESDEHEEIDVKAAIAKREQEKA